MTDQHPITPPLELELQWEEDWLDLEVKHKEFGPYMADRGAQWGADQELEACCEWLADETPTNYINALRDARRPKPPSLKEQALGLLNEGPASDLLDHEVAVIRRALEALPEHPRELIQRLADELTNSIRIIHNEDGTQHISTANPVLDEARAYLSQPEPEGLTLDCDDIDVPPWYRGDDFWVYKEGYAAGWGQAVLITAHRES